MTTIFEDCAGYASPDNIGIIGPDMLNCISKHFEELNKAQESTNDDLLEWMFVLSGSLVFFMQAGFAMVCAGCVRKKNLQNTMLKNILDVCGAAVAFYTVGFGFAFGGQNHHTGTTFIGNSNFLGIGDHQSSFWFFQFVLSATAVTIVAGTLAERCQMSAYLCYSLFLTGFVYPVAAHTIWSNNGVLSVTNVNPYRDIGVIDYAGSGVIHITGGTIALIASYILGPRTGRFYDDDGTPLTVPKAFPGHSIALQLLGTLILWFGWYGFNGGSALLLTHNTVEAGVVAARATANTSLSAATGAMISVFTNLYIKQQQTGEVSFNLGCGMNGALSGLVAITAACGTVELWASFLIGCIGGWLYIFGSWLLVKCRIDDVVDGIPIHFVNGIWGLLAVGLFSSPSAMLESYGTDKHLGFFYSLGAGKPDATLLGNQFIAVLFLTAWSFFLMTPFFIWLNYMGWFRTGGLEEVVGLDIRYHGGTDEGKLEVQEDVLAYKEQMHNQDIKKKRHDRHTSSQASQASSYDGNTDEEKASIKTGSASSS